MGGGNHFPQKQSMEECDPGGDCGKRYIVRWIDR